MRWLFSTPAHDDNDFTPRPGRASTAGERRLNTSLRRSVHRMTGGGLRGRGVRGRFVQGARASDQRVMVKVRIARPRQSRAHLCYLERDGAGRDGQRPAFFDQHTVGLAPQPLVERTKDDRHIFRLIVSPEQSHQLDLVTYTRALVLRMEADLGTPVEWIATAHYNTAHPHVHLLLRGRDAEGQDLYMTRDYIREGIRSQARQLATRALGPRRETSIPHAPTLQPSSTRTLRARPSRTRDGITPEGPARA